MEERDEAGVERDRRKVQGGRWATTVRLARGEARRVGRMAIPTMVLLKGEAVTAHSFPEAAWSWLKSRSQPLAW